MIRKDIKLHFHLITFNKNYIFQSKVEDREMEVKDVLENYTNLEKECESAKQPVSVELQVCKNMFIIINFQ